MTESARLRLRWCGAAHYQLRTDDVLTLIDPLYTRLPGGRPDLLHGPEDLGHIDGILLTHGHLDHARDLAALGLRYDPLVYATRACIDDLARARGRAGHDAPRAHDLEALRGRPFSVGSLTFTPYRVGPEVVDRWFLGQMVIRPLRHRRPGALVEGVRWLTHNLLDRCFAYHVVTGKRGRTILYFGHLTDQVTDLASIDHVDVLAVPYCPANRQWARHTQHLVNRFRPEVTLVHHFDDFMHPYTSARYLDLGEYAEQVRRGAPSARFFFSKFEKDVTLDQICSTAE